MKSMEEAGMKAALLLYPDKEFLMKSPEAFMEDLRSIPPLVGLVTGENFTFGKGAAGRASMLLQHFTGTPVAVKVVSLQNEMEGAVSSTLIRKHIMEGEMEKASMLLGRNYTTAGEVVHGFQRGSGLLGFPTANMRLREDRVIPPDGVYATRAGVNGRVYPAVTNVGKNPTFGNRERTIETFIFHFDESIYGRPFYLEWVSRLRGEVRFSSIGALKQQIEKDIVRAESILGR